MIDKSRIAIYDYLYSLLFGVVTNNVHSMGEPSETTDDEAENGFVVTQVGDIEDESEFEGRAYAWARCYVYAYVPKLSRGRLNKRKYKEYEDAIMSVIKNAETQGNDDYYIKPETTISMDNNDNTMKGNQYHIFVKSFVVVIDKQEQD